MIDLGSIIEQLPAFAGAADGAPLFSRSDGLLLTLELLLLPLAAGLLLSIPLALARNARSPVLARSVWIYTYLFRGTPMLVQLFLVYYGLAQFDAVRASWAWPWLREPLVCALLTFTLNTTAYTTEIIAGQIRATDWREVEAGLAMGMSRLQLWRRIVLPSALRRALPAYGNEVVMLLHGTAIASLVTLVDLTGVARQLYSGSYNPFEPFLIAGAGYLALTYAIGLGFRALERRYLAHLRQRPA